VTTSGQVIADQMDSIYFDNIYFYARAEHKWDVFNRFGRKISPREFESVKPAVNNVVPVRRKDLWGLIDFQGSPVTGFKFDAIGNSGDNKVAVNYLGKWGVIDMFGDWLIKPSFDSLVFVGKNLLAKVKGTYRLITSDGKTLFTSSYPITDREVYFEIASENSVGILSQSGIVIVEPIYDSVGRVGPHYCAMLENRAVLVDSLGTYRLGMDEHIEQILDYSEGYFRIRRGGRYGFVDENGKLRIADRYEDAQLFSNKMAAIMLNGKFNNTQKAC